MKRKENITEKQVRTYLKEYGINEVELINNLKTNEGREQLNVIFERFAQTRIDKNRGVIITAEYDSGEQRETVLGKAPDFNIARITSLQDFVQMMNATIDIHNKGVERIEIAQGIIEELSPARKETFHHILDDGESRINELKKIAKTRELDSSDFTSERLDAIKYRNETLKALQTGSKQRLDELHSLQKKSVDKEETRVVGYAKINDDGSVGDLQPLDIEPIPVIEVTPISLNDLKQYIKDHSEINPDDLYNHKSFVRQTKAGQDILNESLKHFTDYEMKTGTGMVYTDPEKEGQKIVYQRVLNFDQIMNLEDFTAHMNRINMYKERNYLIMKEVSKQEKNKENEQER